jgi:branched-chain amino acid transport system substrate-binding protein
MNKTFSIIVLVLIIIGAGWYYYGQSTKSVPATGEPIKIGAVLSLTGDASVDGLNIKRGLEMAKEDLAAKGVNVEVVYEDDQTDPKRTISAITKLVTSSDSPKAIIGPIWSFLIDSALPVINQNKIVSFIPSATTEITTSDSSYAFYGTFKNIEETKPLAEWLKANKKTKVAIVVNTGAWSESQEQAFGAAADLAGSKVVLTERLVGFDGTAVPTVLAKVKSSGADVILWTGFEKDSAILIKKSQEQNLGIPIVAASNAPKGLVSRGVVILRPQDEVYTIDIPRNPKFTEKFTKKYSEDPSTYSDSAYDGLIMLVEGLQKYPAGGDELANYMREMTYRGYLGKYDFDDKGDIVGGTWEIVRLK